jgi:hypothetical protein
MLIRSSGFGTVGVVAASYGLGMARDVLATRLVVALPEGGWVV